MIHWKKFFVQILDFTGKEQNCLRNNFLQNWTKT